MTGMRMLKLWVVVMLLGLLPVVSEAQEEINNAINVQLEYLKKYPKDKDALPGRCLFPAFEEFNDQLYIPARMDEKDEFFH